MKESVLGLLVLVLATTPGGCSKRTESRAAPNIVRDAFAGRIERVDRWLQLGVPIEYRDRSFLNRTPLLAAASAHDSQMVSYLLAKGADPNAADGHGNTPLIWAVMSDCDSNVVELLLSHGADPSLKNKNGSSASDYGGWQYYVWMRSNIFLTNTAGWRK